MAEVEQVEREEAPQDVPSSQCRLEMQGELSLYLDAFVAADQVEALHSLMLRVRQHIDPAAPLELAAGDSGQDLWLEFQIGWDWNGEVTQGAELELRAGQAAYRATGEGDRLPPGAYLLHSGQEATALGGLLEAQLLQVCQVSVSLQRWRLAEQDQQETGNRWNTEPLG